MKRDTSNDICGCICHRRGAKSCPQNSLGKGCGHEVCAYCFKPIKDEVYREHSDYCKTVNPTSLVV